MKRIAFIGPLSNSKVRSQLNLRSYNLRNILMKILKHREYGYPDQGSWVSEYVEYFESHTDEYEFHLITVHPGVKEPITEFSFSDIHYHVINSSSNLLIDYLNYKLKIDERSNYGRFRKKIFKIIKNINPSLVVVCGAENPQYSLAALDLKEYKTYVILQTLLNSEKRKSLNVGSDYRRSCEEIVINAANFIGVSSDDEYHYVRQHNPSAIVIRNIFPSKIPPTFEEVKDVDFVFFANAITKFKGIEDALLAFAEIVRKGRKCKLRVVGSFDVDYFEWIRKIVQENDIEGCVEFSGYCQAIDDVYRYVQRSRNILLPSITAPFNSTVKEGMFMRIPVIMYDTDMSNKINHIAPTLLTAEMENVQDLADKMTFALDNRDYCESMAKIAQAYAYSNFSGKAAGELLQKAFDEICGDQNYENIIYKPVNSNDRVH